MTVNFQENSLLTELNHEEASHLNGGWKFWKKVKRFFKKNYRTILRTGVGLIAGLFGRKRSTCYTYRR